MKIKVGFFDRILFKDFLYILSASGVFFSFFSIIIDVSEKAKLFVGIALIIILFIIYFVMWRAANKLTSLELSIDNSKVIVKLGNLFEEQGFKVIAFNEYFDTIVDNEIISQNTLNGFYLNNIISNVEELDTLIEQNESLREKVADINENRVRGKKKRYKLGTIFRNDDFLLTAFSRFDDNNRAFLNMNDYIGLLLNFWNEIDIIYAGKSVVLPLMGSGITRFKEYNNITDQELLELLLWSFKISRIKFTYPSTVTIIIHQARKDKINFYKLRGVI
ncbi:macro domain-containing protein [Paenibacillus sp.]|uniref:macro domain-containing protein n=1 Tax=Paenibacillus sp. TaxID=58172 RepID=UPI0028AA02C1|nr:macro domain-containing protein [Paenibacillus sp.]